MSSDLFHGDPDTVPGFQNVAFWNINVKPQGLRVILRRVLGHQAVFMVIDVGDELYLRFKLQKFYHDKKR
jgi:hypothetical protein